MNALQTMVPNVFAQRAAQPMPTQMPMQAPMQAAPQMPVQNQMRPAMMPRFTPAMAHPGMPQLSSGLGGAPQVQNALMRRFGAY